MITTYRVKALIILALVSGTIVADSGFRKFNSYECAKCIPGVNDIIQEGERIQKTKIGELKEIEQKAQKLMAEIQKDQNDLMSKRAAMRSDALYKEENKIKDKQRKMNDYQTDYQRIMHEGESEMQAVQMRLQPYMMEVIQNAIELASKDPHVEELFDEATQKFVYIKDSANLNSEVIKVTEKKNEQKTALAKNKAAATPKPAAKAA